MAHSQKSKFLVALFLLLAFLIAALPLVRITKHYSRIHQIETERQKQREQILARIQSVGGWDVLKKACVSLAEQRDGESFEWYNLSGRGLMNSRRDDTNQPPIVITALQPKRIEFHPPKTSYFNDSDLPVVRITMFGEQRTGGSRTPWLGLDIVCSRNADYRPNRKATDYPLRYWQYRKITEDVYEFF